MNTQQRTLITALGVLVVVALGSMLVGGGMMGPGMMWGYDGTAHVSGWSWGLGMAFGWIGMLAMLGAVVLGGILFARWVTDHPSMGSGTHVEDARSILRRRYAAGEIDQATFERMKRELDV